MSFIPGINKVSSVNNKELSYANRNGGNQDGYKYYTVVKGDSLSKIARQNDTTWEILWELNKNTLRSGKPELIFPGEVIKIPIENREEIPGAMPPPPLPDVVKPLPKLIPDGDNVEAIVPEIFEKGKVNTGIKIIDDITGGIDELQSGINMIEGTVNNVIGEVTGAVEGLVGNVVGSVGGTISSAFSFVSSFALGPLSGLKLVLDLGSAWKAHQHAHLMKTQETNLARINQLNQEIKSIENKQKVLAGNLVNQLNQSSRVLNTKSIDTTFAQKTLTNIISYGSFQLPVIGGNKNMSHTIRKGETLHSIAQKYGVSSQILWKLNQSTLNSGNPDLIYPGEKIILPQNAQKDVRISKVISQNNYHWSQLTKPNISTQTNQKVPISKALQAVSKTSVPGLSLIDIQKKADEFHKKNSWWSANRNNQLMGGRLWRSIFTVYPYLMTGGEVTYMFNKTLVGFGVYSKNIDLNKFILMDKMNEIDRVNNSNQFLVLDAEIDEALLVNRILGNFIYGEGPENLVFPHNGYVALNYIKNSPLNRDIIYTLYNSSSYLNKLKNKDFVEFSVNIDPARFIELLLKHLYKIAKVNDSVITNIDQLIGTCNVRIKKLSNGDLQVEIFNITSLNSADFVKDITPNVLVPELQNTRRANSRSQNQIGYTNVSQYFSYTITQQEIKNILRFLNFNPNTKIID